MKRDLKLTSYIDESRRSERVEELEDFKNASVKQKSLVTQASIQTQTEGGQEVEKCPDKIEDINDKIGEDLTPPFR